MFMFMFMFMFVYAYVCQFLLHTKNKNKKKRERNELIKQKEKQKNKIMSQKKTYSKFSQLDEEKEEDDFVSQRITTPCVFEFEFMKGTK